MQTYSLAEPLTIGALREVLKYRSREAMSKNWRNIFPDQVLPLDHLTVEPVDAVMFVQEIAKPQRGRPGDITGAAQLFLKTLNGSDSIEAPSTPDKIERKPKRKIAQVEKVVETIEAPIIETSPTFWDRMLEKVLNLSGLDLVYFTTICIADYGLIFLLKEMGLAAALVYTLISLHALAMAKDRHSQQTATIGIAAVWFLEIGAFVIHLTLFHKRLWESVSDLPFKIDDPSDESRPFYIACVLAFLFAAAGIYAVSVTLALLKEKIEAEEFESAHGVKY